jgi:AraC family transcriptional regulator
MKAYILLLNSVIDYIEDNITEKISLMSISHQFHISEFHFSRLFKIVVGSNFKQYILARKLTKAAESLKNNHNTVTSVAFKYGFEYTEVFSRAFKKQFGISPSEYKKDNIKIHKIPKAFIVERNVTNVKGTLAIKSELRYLEAETLFGNYLEVNESSSDFEYQLNLKGTEFYQEYSEHFINHKLYSVVNCHEDESGDYTVFFGGLFPAEFDTAKLQTRFLPDGWYACFHYYANMLDIRSTFVDDLYRWILIKEIRLSDNGIGMINLYDKKDMNNIMILVPIEKIK